MVAAAGALLLGAQPALAATPSLVMTVSGHNVNFTGAGFTPSGQVQVKMLYQGYTSRYHQFVGGGPLVVWTGNASPNQQVCFGFPFQHCIGDPGGKISLTLPMAQLANDIATDFYNVPPAHDPVPPCAATTTAEFYATDVTLFNAGDNGDSETGFTGNIHLNCIIAVAHPPRHHPHHHK